MELAVIVLSFTVLVSLVFIGLLYSKNVGLQKEIVNIINRAKKWFYKKYEYE